MIIMSEEMFTVALVMRWLIIAEHWAVKFVNSVQSRLGELTAASRHCPVLAEGSAPDSEPQYLHHSLDSEYVSPEPFDPQVSSCDIHS
jgi:hypothetical protein